MSVRTRLLTARPRTLGVAFVILCILVAGVAFKRNVITTTLTPGETISATFARDYRLREYASTVKIAGVPVGTVTNIAQVENGYSRVSLKLYDGAEQKLGTSPSAAIRPTTLLGGQYYVDLTPGGDPGAFHGDISLERTRIAVEADAVLESLQPRARVGVQQFVAKTDETLRGGGQPALRDLLRDAPASLGPAGPALDALTGDKPDTLENLVSNLDSAARVLNQQQGQVSSILASTNRVAGVLDQERAQLSQTVGELPSTLRTTRTGLVDLRGSLGRLTSAANDLQPTAEALDPLLAKVDPVLVKARPVVADLREVLVDARPLVRDLVPTTDRASNVLEDLDGTVLDNINGPILNALNTPWHGVGGYQGNGSKYTLYQDIAYAFTGLGRSFKYVDKDGHVAAIQVGQGIDEVSDFRGLPNFEQFLRGTIGPKESPR